MKGQVERAKGSLSCIDPPGNMFYHSRARLKYWESQSQEQVRVIVEESEGNTQISLLLFGGGWRAILRALILKRYVLLFACSCDMVS